LAQIRALETRGDSEILTVPSVVTLNNLEATFSARQSFYVKVSGNQDASLTQVTAETLLKVTPLVAQAETRPGNGSDRRIRLLISVQDGTVDASTSAVVDNLPRTLENQISTQAVVRGGDTLVIGGQVVRKRVNRVSGIPIIKDIPILGALTNSRSDDFEQYVRVYVVRPRILGDGSLLNDEPVEAQHADPLVHGIVGRVPELIRGSGLSPRVPDAERPASPRGAVDATLVVPVPQPQSAAMPQATTAREAPPSQPSNDTASPPAASGPASAITPAADSLDDVPPPGPAGC
jgi:type III secretion protein C